MNIPLRNVVLNELNNCIIALRTNVRFSSKSRFQFEIPRSQENNLLAKLKDLKEQVLVDFESIKLNEIFTPFLSLIESEETTGPITGVALNSVKKFLSYPILKVENPHSKVMIHSIVKSLKGCQFEVTDMSTDESILVIVLEVFFACVNCEGGSLLSEKMVFDVFKSCYRIGRETRPSDYLRRNCEKYLEAITEVSMKRVLKGMYDNQMSKLFNFICNLSHPNKEGKTSSLRLLGLTMGNLVFEIFGKKICEYPKLLKLAQDRFCRSILCNADSQNIVILSQTLKGVENCIFCLPRINEQIERFLIHIHLTIGDSKQSPNDLKELILESFIDLFSFEDFPLFLYHHFDCNETSFNLLENIVKFLSQQIKQSDHHINTLHLLSFKALLQITHSLFNRCDRRKQRLLSSFQKEQQQQQIKEKNSSSSSSPLLTNELYQNYRESKMKKYRMMNFCDAINQNPKVLVETIEKSGLSIAAFFKRYSKWIKTSVIGQFLNEEKNEPHLKEFVNLFDFEGMPLDLALREFVYYCFIRGESQQVMRILEHIANRYFSQNKDLEKCYVEEETPCFQFAVWIMMLQSDLHNKQNRNKMEFKTFFDSSMTNIFSQNKTKKVTEREIRRIYDSIKQNPFISLDKGTKEHLNDFAWEEWVVKKSLDESIPQFHEIDNSIYDCDLFESIWGSISGAIRIVLQRSNDPLVVNWSMDGLKESAKISSFYGLRKTFDHIIVSLGRWSQIIQYGSLKGSLNSLYSTIERKGSGAFNNNNSNERREDVEKDFNENNNNNDYRGRRNSSLKKRHYPISGGVFGKEKPDEIIIRLGGSEKGLHSLKTVFFVTRNYGDALGEGWKTVVNLILVLYELGLLKFSFMDEPTSIWKNYYYEEREKRRKKSISKKKFPDEGNGGGGWLFGFWGDSDSSESRNNLFHERKHEMALVEDCVRSCRIPELLKEVKGLGMSSNSRKSIEYLIKAILLTCTKLFETLFGEEDDDDNNGEADKEEERTNGHNSNNNNNSEEEAEKEKERKKQQQQERMKRQQERRRRRRIQQMKEEEHFVDVLDERVYSFVFCLQLLEEMIVSCSDELVLIWELIKKSYQYFMRRIKESFEFRKPPSNNNNIKQQQQQRKKKKSSFLSKNEYVVYDHLIYSFFNLYGRIMEKYDEDEINKEKEENKEKVLMKSHVYSLFYEMISFGENSEEQDFEELYHLPLILNSTKKFVSYNGKKLKNEDFFWKFLISKVFVSAKQAKGLLLNLKESVKGMTELGITFPSFLSFAEEVFEGDVEWVEILFSLLEDQTIMKKKEDSESIDETLWTNLVKMLMRCCESKDRNIRNVAISKLQRILLEKETIHSNTLSEETVLNLFTNILFPVLERFLSIEKAKEFRQTRLRIAGLISKVFLHFLGRISQREDQLFSIWVKLLQFDVQCMKMNCEFLTESTPEHLKNRILVMDAQKLLTEEIWKHTVLEINQSKELNFILPELKSIVKREISFILEESEQQQQQQEKEEEKTEENKEQQQVDNE